MFRNYNVKSWRRLHLLKIHFIMSCFSKYLIYNALSVIFYGLFQKISIVRQVEFLKQMKQI